MLPRFHFTIERWKKNEEYGVYVSTLGNIKLIRTKEDVNVRINGGGYCVVFTDKGVEFVHRLVAYTWLGGKRNAKFNIDHINSNKRDNSVSNLRWIERSLNEEYARYTQTCLSPDENPNTDVDIESDKALFTKATTKLSLPQETRGTMLMELLKKNLLIITANEQTLTTHEEIEKLHQEKATTLTLPVFLARIAHAHKQNITYCNIKWKLTFKDN